MADNVFKFQMINTRYTLSLSTAYHIAMNMLVSAACAQVTNCYEYYILLPIELWFSIKKQGREKIVNMYATGFYGI